MTALRLTNMPELAQDRGSTYNKSVCNVKVGKKKLVQILPITSLIHRKVEKRTSFCFNTSIYLSIYLYITATGTML